MYDDFATIKLEEFEKVAKEYNKMLKVNACSVNKQDENNSQLIKSLTESKANVVKLLNFCRNMRAKTKIKELVNDFDTLSVKPIGNEQRQEVINQKGFALNFNFRFLGSNIGYYNTLKNCLNSVANSLTLVSSDKDKQMLLQIHNTLTDLLVNFR